MVGHRYSRAPDGMWGMKEKEKSMQHQPEIKRMALTFTEVGSQEDVWKGKMRNSC